MNLLANTTLLNFVNNAFVLISSVYSIEEIRTLKLLQVNSASNYTITAVSFLLFILVSFNRFIFIQIIECMTYRYMNT